MSSAFSALTHARGLWTDLLRRYVISEGLPVPKLRDEIKGDPADLPTTIPDALDSAALEGCIRRALTLRRAWTSPSPKPARHLVVSVQEEGFIKLVDLKNNKTTTNLVNMLDVKREDGEPITDWADWQLSADMKYILVKTDYVKVRGVHTLITLKLTDA